mgnify:CR=1 FL=1
MNNKGFTILEVMASISIFMVVVLLVADLLNNTVVFSSERSNLAELIQNSRVAIDRISREVRQANELITEIATTTPSNEIMFQDGHDLSQISYIKYYLNNSTLYRDNILYYFPLDPSIYVYYDDVDVFNNSPTSTSSTQMIGEYFDDLDITKSDGLLELQLSLSKNNETFQVGTNIFIRNW